VALARSLGMEAQKVTDAAELAAGLAEARKAQAPRLFLMDVFWNNMSPDGGDKPTGELAAALDDAFGDFDKFRGHFEAVATSIQGSGWAVLGWDLLGQALTIEQLYDQQGNVQMGYVPLLQLD
ncbi:superoxide dismutase, partial [Brevibacterium paucivorans]|uniref:superoxide dismutase n=1 Tax=Brevibacterium paucivorans TaxID=170994 RepID=UPI0021557BC8